MLKKKMLAVAVASTLAAPFAMADVNIYGAISASVETVKATGSTNAANDVKSIGRLSSNTSKLGFKGSDDLGNGMKALWQIEQEISVDDGGTRRGTFATRNSFVGVEGDFGRILLGNNDTVYKSIAKAGMVNTMVETIADICVPSAVYCRGDARLQNSVHYYTKNYSGFQAGASYGFDEARTTVGGARTNKARWSVAASYAVDGLSAGLGYDVQQQKNAVAGNTNLDQSFMKVSLGYKFDDTKLSLGYEHEKNEKSTGDLKQSAWTVGAEQKFGPVAVGLVYATMGESKSGAKDGADQVTLGAIYDLSKRTQTYAYYSRITNEDAATRTFGGAGLSGVGAGSNPTGLGVGMKVSF